MPIEVSFSVWIWAWTGISLDLCQWLNIQRACVYYHPINAPENDQPSNATNTTATSSVKCDTVISYSMLFFLFFVFCLTDFLPSLKSLFGNPVYFLYLCASTIQFNSLFGMVTYKPKYIEQQYGQSSSKANFVIGMLISPSCFPIGTINHVLWILSHFREIVPIFRLKVMYGTSKSEWEKKKKNLAG